MFAPFSRPPVFLNFPAGGKSGARAGECAVLQACLFKINAPMRRAQNKMTTNAVISFLSNKKTTIWALVAEVVVWSFGRGYMAQDTLVMITHFGVILGLTANVITAKYYANKKAEDEYVVKNQIAAAVADAKTGVQ